MGIATPSTDDSKYPLWHRQPQHKTPSPDVPRPYTTPKEMGAAGHDALINKELGSEDVYDPLQSMECIAYTGTANTTHVR